MAGLSGFASAGQSRPLLVSGVDFWIPQYLGRCVLFLSNKNPVYKHGFINRAFINMFINTCLKTWFSPSKGKFRQRGAYFCLVPSASFFCCCQRPIFGLERVIACFFWVTSSTGTSNCPKNNGLLKFTIQRSFSVHLSLPELTENPLERPQIGPEGKISLNWWQWWELKTGHPAWGI